MTLECLQFIRENNKYARLRTKQSKLERYMVRSEAEGCIQF